MESKLEIRFWLNTGVYLIRIHNSEHVCIEKVVKY